MTNFKDDLTECKCLCCKNKLKERFSKFSNHDNNKFILLFQKGVCPYQYIDDWEKFNRASLTDKKYIYILLIQIMQTQNQFIKIFK